MKTKEEVKIQDRPNPKSLMKGWAFLFLASFVFTASTVAYASLISDLNGASRIMTWAGNIGVPGGIPPLSSMTQCGSTILAGSSDTTVNNVLSSCSPGQYVQLAAGTFTFSNTINIVNSGVVLNGAGIGQTIINTSAYTAVLMGNTNWYQDWANPNPARHVDWTSGFSQGSTTITVASTGDLQVGEMIYMDELNDANATAIGSQGAPDPSSYSSVANPNNGQDRYQFQINRVTGISGNTITLSDPVYMPNYAAGLDPQIWWYGSGPVTGVGIQNMTINGTDGNPSQDQGIYIENVYGGWVYNVEMYNSRYGINTWAVLRSTIEHNYVHNTFSLSNTALNDLYCMQTHASSGLLIDNNITNSGNILINGMSGSVVAYNYLSLTTGGPPYLSGGIFFHGGNPNMNLIEGNYAPGFWSQMNWGSAEYNTGLRNNFIGNDIGTPFVLDDDFQAVDVNAQQHYITIIGNVLGNTSTTQWYQDDPNNYSPCHSNNYQGSYHGRIFSIGMWSGQCNGPLDPVALSTLFQADNWVAATGGLPSGTTNGLVLGSYPMSDVPNSLYLSSKPSWFGSLAWPPYDPSNPTAATLNSIPAGYRYTYGVDPNSTINYGDVNGDGNVTVYDAELTAQYAVGLPVANFNTMAAEVDGNSTVDIYDAYLIAEYAVGVINKFPIQNK